MFSSLSVESTEYSVEFMMPCRHVDVAHCSRCVAAILYTLSRVACLCLQFVVSFAVYSERQCLCPCLRARV